VRPSFDVDQGTRFSRSTAKDPNPMRMRTTPRHRSRSGALTPLFLILPLVTVATQLLLVAPVVEAGAVYPNPPNATPSAWPSSFTSYTTDTGTPISDVEGESGVGSVFDISSSAGTSASVFLALSGGAAFFRLRVGSNPIDVSKGGFTGATWLVLIATEDAPGVWTTKAVTGLDGKPVGSAAAPDTVYVGNAPGTGITDVYEFTDVAPAFNPLNAIGTGARVVPASGTQYFIDWQVPVSTLTTASGGAITTSTPVRLFFGSSAAANLATINKDYMSGGAVSFAGLGTMTLSPPTLTLTESKTSISGPNPPQATTASVYDITVTARNTGGSSLLSPSIAVSIPAGVSLVSQSTSTGSIGAAGQTVTWTPGTMIGGAATISATIRVSVTPGFADVGSTITLANAAAGTGTDGIATITGTGTAQTAGPVSDAPHATSTAVSCPGATISYGAAISCTITVSDLTGAGGTVPTGTVFVTPVLGSSTACTLAAATATTATCTVTFTATDVGTGSLSGAYGGDGTHASSSASSGAIPIGKKALTVSVVAASKTYGDPNPTFSAGYSGFVLGDTSAVLGGTLAFSTAATSSTPVGTYAVAAGGLTSAHYALTYDPANLTIQPAPLTIRADDTSRPYGDPNPTLTATYTGFVNGDDPADLASPAVLDTAATASSAPGSFPITVSGATAANYDITLVAGTLTVGKAPLTITVVDVSRVYGDANPSFTVAFSGFQNGDTAADLGGALSCSTTATASSDVGVYPLICGGYSSLDYALTTVDGFVYVTPAILQVVPDPQARTYGAADPALTVSYSGFVNGDTASVLAGAADCSTTATATSGPGTYAIDCSAGTLAATNYIFDVSGSSDLTLTPAALTIAVDPATKVYGSANPAFTVTPTGLQNGETIADLDGALDVSTLAGIGSGVGTYPVTASGLSSPDYTITFEDGTLTVTRATLVVTPVDAAAAPGDPIPTSWVTNVIGFVAGDDAGVLSGTASCSTDATAGDPAGPYTITCTVGSLAAANYDVVIGGTALFTIGIVTLHVAVVDATRNYGDSNPTFGVSYTGFVNGDTAADLGGTLVFTTAATSGSPTGTYPVTASGLTSPDYALDYQAGSLTIEPATQTITFDALAGATFGDAPFNLTATSTSGLAVTFTASGSCSVIGMSVTITAAGSCTITAHQSGDANHEAAPDSAQILTIARATPLLTWATPAAITFGTALSGTQLDAGASVTGSYVYGPAAGSVLGVGTHTLHVTFTPTDTANYAPVTGTADLAIIAAPLTITAADASRPYGDSNPTFSASYSGFVNGDDSADLASPAVLATGATPASGSGTYPIAVSGATSPNYDITFVAGTLTIGPAALTIKADNVARAYGDANPSFTVTTSGFRNGDTGSDLGGSLSCSSGAGPASPVGTYPITCSGVSSADYAITYVTGSLSVTRAALTIAVDPATKAYGAANPAFTVTSTGLQNGATIADLAGALAFATAAGTGSGAGSYSVTPSGLSSPNYAMTFVPGTLTVTKATLHVAVVDATKSYGDPNPTFGVSYSGFVNGDTAADLSGTLVFTTAAASGSPVAIYPVVATGLTSPNYALDYQAGSLTIARATPLLTWATPAAITFGTALSGTQLDAGASVTGSYVYGPAAGSVLGVGTHTLHVTFTPTDTANYAPVSGTAEISVERASQTITFASLPDTTSGAPISLAATASSGLPVTYTVAGPCSVAGTSLTITAAGTCTVTAHQAGDGEFEAADPVSVSFDAVSGLSSSIETDHDVVSQGGHVLVTATGFKPGSEVEVRLLSSGAVVTVVADADGVVQALLTISPTATEGPHVIEARGVDPLGGVLAMTAPIKVLVLPSTSTVDGSEPPAGGQLVLAGLLLLLLAAGASWWSVTPRRRRAS
jgi:hypothetical protein